MGFLSNIHEVMARQKKLQNEIKAAMPGWNAEVERIRQGRYGKNWRSAIQFPGRKRDTLTATNNISINANAGWSEDGDTGNYDFEGVSVGSPEPGAKKYFVMRSEPLDASKFMGGRYDGKPANFDAWTTDWLGKNSDWLNDGTFVKHKIGKNSVYRVKVGGAWRPLVVFFNQVWIEG